MLIDAYFHIGKNIEMDFQIPRVLWDKSFRGLGR